MSAAKLIASMVCHAAFMMRYRRNFVSGGRFFFTVNLAEHRLRLLTDPINLLRPSFRDVRRRHPFAIDAIIVLPDQGLGG